MRRALPPSPSPLVVLFLDDDHPARLAEDRKLPPTVLCSTCELAASSPTASRALAFTRCGVQGFEGPGTKYTAYAEPFLRPRRTPTRAIILRIHPQRDLVGTRMSERNVWSVWRRQASCRWPARDARKAHRHPAAVAGALGDALEVELEDVHGLDRADGPKRSRVCWRIHRSETVDLLVGEARISLRHRDQLAWSRGRKSGRSSGWAPAVTGLRVHQHRVDGVRLDLPLPPVAPRPAVPVWESQRLSIKPSTPVPGLLRSSSRSSQVAASTRARARADRCAPAPGRPASRDARARAAPAGRSHPAPARHRP